MPTAAVGIDKPVGIERGPGYPGGNGLLMALVYADGLTAAVGIAPTSSIRVARHVIDPRRSPVRGVANLCRRPGPWMLPRHRSPPFATSSIRGRVRRYGDGLGKAVGIPLFFYIIYFFLFFTT